MFLKPPIRFHFLPDCAEPDTSLHELDLCHFRRDSYTCVDLVLCSREEVVSWAGGICAQDGLDLDTCARFEALKTELSVKG